MRKKFTPQAALVVSAIEKASEAGSEHVWFHAILRAILKLSIPESAIARALNDDRVWNRTSREQLIRALSGRPEYDWLRPPSSIGFRPSDLVEKAEASAIQGKTSHITERHVAEALVEVGRPSLIELGVDGERLVSLVTELEGGFVEALCFVLMPFSAELEDVYTSAIKPAAEKAGLRCERADEITVPGVVLTQIDERIQLSQVIVADLTNSNPNVAQELGFARALQKPLVLLAQDVKDLPFDVRHFRVLKYKVNPSGLKSLRERLTPALIETRRGRN